MRRWTINGRFLSQDATGVQRVAREIVRALDEILAEGAFGEAGPRLDLVAPPDAEIDLPLNAIAARKAGRLTGHAWEQAELPGLAPEGLVSLCNTGPVRHRRQILCVHDMNTRLAPQSYAPGFRALYRVLLPMLGRSVLALATVSDFSAGAIAGHGVRRRNRIAVIPNGHEHALRWQSRHSPVTRRFAGRDVIVAIGSPARHKNLDLLLGMSERLAAEGLRLAIVGRADPRVHGAGSGTEAGRAAWLGRLDDDELAALLEDALCLAFPSWTEGFGMPPLEAMARGCPVIASDRASLPEVCGPAALYAPPDAPEIWLDRFLALRDAPGLRAGLVARGRERLARFRWRAAAEAYLGLMAEVDGVAAADAA